MIPQESKIGLQIRPQPRPRSKVYLALHNIRSCHNVGSIFRTADAAGVSKIFICGATPSPIDRFGRDRKDISKVSLGAEKTVKWQYVKNIDDLLADLKKKKFKIYALEQDARAVDYRKAKIGNKDLLILGNEVHGIEKRILEKCDVVLEIPMKGKKESLNVAVAAGIALFSLL